VASERGRKLQLIAIMAALAAVKAQSEHTHYWRAATGFPARLATGSRTPIQTRRGADLP